MKTQPNTSITIGIPTYHCGENLIRTINSITSQSAYDKISKIIIVVDGNKIPPEIKAKISNSKVTIIESPKREGQATRINDIFESAQTDLLVLTNDDVLLAKDAVSSLLHAYSVKRTDLICPNVVPIKGKTLLDSILFVGTKIKNHLLESIPNGNSYLACNGRLIALSKNLYKKLKIPKNLINNDAYIYLFSRQYHFTFFFLDKALCFFSNPNRLIEYLNQTTKFQSSLLENSQYFTEETIKVSYSLPYFSQITSYAFEFLTDPIFVSGYFVLLIFSRLYGLFNKRKTLINLAKKGFWETDISTKN